MKAVILAGGRGSRLSEFTKDRNKAMIMLYEKPLLQYNLDRAIEANVNEIIIVLCYKPEEIKEYFNDSYKGVKITYIIEKEGKGLVNALENAKGAIGQSDFILMLGDEILIEYNIKGMIRKFKREDVFGICGITYETDRYSIGKTYTAMVNEKGRAFRLIEKPKVKLNNIKGTGHCVLKNEILNYIDRTPINAVRGQKELVDLIQVAIDDGKKVYVHPITRNYTNINIKEDYDSTKDLIKKSNPKVLIVHNQMKYYGGAELLIVELCNWLTKMGIRNDILTLSKSKEVERDLINTEIIIPKNDLNIVPPGYKSIKDIFKGIYIFRKKLDEIKDKYDVINFHDYPVTWSLWPYKKPAVWFMNLPPNLWSKPDAGLFYKILNKLRIYVDKFIIKSSMDVITVAEIENKKRAMERYGRKAKFLSFGIDYDFFSGGNEKNVIDKFKLKNKFVVIQSGMICEARNQLESIKAIKEIKDKIPDILLILTGKEDAEYLKNIEKYIKDNNLEKYVNIAGHLETRDELSNLFKAADLGIFPVGKQGGILAPFEVLSAGTPIIVSEDIETANMIKKDNLGIVTKNYGEAIREVYNNKSKYKEIGVKGSHYIRDNMTWKEFSDKMLKAYKIAWNKHRKRSETRA